MSDEQAYGSLLIAIDGPNVYSRSALARFFDNALARPLGVQARVTICFEHLDTEAADVAVLVGQIVAAAEGQDGR